MLVLGSVAGLGVEVVLLGVVVVAGVVVDLNLYQVMIVSFGTRTLNDCHPSDAAQSLKSAMWPHRRSRQERRRSPQGTAPPPNFNSTIAFNISHLGAKQATPLASRTHHFTTRARHFTKIIFEGATPPCRRSPKAYRLVGF